jgi:hypothetical protein
VVVETVDAGPVAHAESASAAKPIPVATAAPPSHRHENCTPEVSLQRRYKSTRAGMQKTAWPLAKSGRSFGWGGARLCVTFTAIEAYAKTTATGFMEVPITEGI